MAHREFTDQQGRAWEAWEVVPTAIERRSKSPQPYAGPERRRQHELRLVVSDQLRQGWLTFQSGRERRRLAPAPQGWQSLEDGDLRDLLGRSTVVGPVRRLIE